MGILILGALVVIAAGMGVGTFAAYKLGVHEAIGQIAGVALVGLAAFLWLKAEDRKRSQPAPPATVVATSAAAGGAAHSVVDASAFGGQVTDAPAAHSAPAGDGALATSADAFPTSADAFATSADAFATSADAFAMTAGSAGSASAAHAQLGAGSEDTFDGEGSPGHGLPAPGSASAGSSTLVTAAPTLGLVSAFD